MKATELHSFKAGGAAKQHGAILVITLVILVAMTLASVGLFRSVDTSTLLSANIGFKRDLAARASVALKAIQKEVRMADFQSIAGTFCVSVACTANDRNYSPQVLETDPDGIPVVLNSSSFGTDFSGTWGSTDEQAAMTAAQVSIRYIIERMCDAVGPASTERCAYGDIRVLEGKNQGDYRGDRGPLGGKADTSMSPLFRITIRATGPRNSIAYAQAFYNIP